MDDGRKGIFMSVKKNAHSGEHAHAGYMMKGWKLRLLRLLALLIIVCVGAAACSKKDNDTAQEPFTVKLGVLLDFSGGYIRPSYNLSISTEITPKTHVPRQIRLPEHNAANPCPFVPVSLR